MGNRSSKKDSTNSKHRHKTCGEIFSDNPSSSRRHSRVEAEQKQRRSCSVTSNVVEAPNRKCSDPRMASEFTASESCLKKTQLLSNSNRFLTADNSASGRRSRQRSMSARKPNELRPHMADVSPNKCTGGSVRMRRTSETVNEIGQLRLTPVQIGLVRRLWQNVRAQGENGAGLQILRDHLFFRHPETREIFSVQGAAGGSSAESNYHKRLMGHAEALGGLLDEVIANLESAEFLREKIRDLGRMHAKSRDMGFKAQFWDNLAEAANECTTSWCQKAQRPFEAQVAMMTIFMFIIDHLKDGYMDECRRVRRSMYDGGSRERRGVSPDARRLSPRHSVFD